jgi:hypothetical protein
VEEAFDIIRSVDAKKVFGCGEGRFEESEAVEWPEEVTDHAIFRDGEAVLFG